jgi:hypothetical protein
MLLLGFAASAWAAKPPTGVFQGIVNGTPHSPVVCGTVHNEGEGYLRVKRTSNGGRKIVPVGNSNYCGGLLSSLTKIQVPSDAVANSNCNPQLGNVYLKAASVPLSQGAFDYTGKTVNLNGQETGHRVQFKGSWDAGISRFKGFTRIIGCTGKKYWRMKKVAN